MPDRPRQRLLLTAFGLCLVIGVMTGLVSYSVTLYRLFCQATGAGGTPQVAASVSPVRSQREVTVSFNTDVAPGLPWRFRPMQARLRVRLGQDTLVWFEAENLADRPITGHATFNVTPERVGIYFKKIQCFCFSEERLAPRQKVTMPVSFYVDPQLDADPDTTGVHVITLSYTFFASRTPETAQDPGQPDLVTGHRLFTSACLNCHALDRDKVGPRLNGVIGRRAGSVAGYPYSPALTRANLVWTAETLDRWLADPGAFVPGAAMPFHVPDAAQRRAIIAYLQTLGSTPAVLQRDAARPPSTR